MQTKMVKINEKYISNMSHISAFLVCIAMFLCYPSSAHVLPETTADDSEAVLNAARLFPTLPIFVSGSANQKCLSDSQLVLDNLRNSTTWAEQMLDASAKSVEGLYIGSFFQMGNFKECIDTEIPIQGQYCIATLTLHPPASVGINHSADIYNPLGSIWDKIGHDKDRSKAPRNVVHSALCVPASCSHSDLQASLSRHLAKTPRNHSISVEVKPELCQTNRKGQTLSAGAIAYCVVMGTVLLLVILGTLFDHNTYSSGSERGQPSIKLYDGNTCGYLQCFSLKMNIYEVGKSSKSRLGCIYGLKVLSTCGVIYAHTLLLNLGGPAYNYELYEKGHSNIFNDMLAQIETVVDSFFVMGAILATYITLCTLEKRSVNPLQVIIARYLRLTPVYMVVVFFYATLLYHTGEGPLWTAMIGPEQQFCRDNWWANLLFINNYVNDDRMCMIHSWYMAPEFHFFVITIFLVLIIHKWPKAGYIALGICMAVSFIIPYAITLFYHLDPVQFFYADGFILPRTVPYFRYAYSKSHVHATPTFVGVATGLLLYRTRSSETKYTWQSTVGLVVGLLMIFGSLVPGALAITHAWRYTDAVAALVQPQRRFFWPLGLAMVIISLAFSKDSTINKALSSQTMVCLSKFSFTAYLVSFGLQMTHAATVVTPQKGIEIYYIREALADICSSFAVAFVLYLTVEAPFDKLITKLLQLGRSKPSTKA